MIFIKEKLSTRDQWGYLISTLYHLIGGVMIGFLLVLLVEPSRVTLAYISGVMVAFYLVMPFLAQFA